MQPVSEGQEPNHPLRPRGHMVARDLAGLLNPGGKPTPKDRQGSICGGQASADSQYVRGPIGGGTKPPGSHHPGTMLYASKLSWIGGKGLEG